MNSQTKRLFSSNSVLITFHFIASLLLLLVLLNENADILSKAVCSVSAIVVLILTVRYVIVIEVFPSHLRINRIGKKQYVSFRDIECIEQCIGWLWRIRFRNSKPSLYFYNFMNRKMIEFLGTKTTIHYLPSYQNMQKK
ncbi:MAG: hypothetical protein DRH12_14770 [Deltaproteobacteria bacterium]|nr:MAG: hypothetical protein DRH12_14770 [Deltaproteobacteria bacterium]